MSLKHGRMISLFLFRALANAHDCNAAKNDGVVVAGREVGLAYSSGYFVINVTLR